MGLIDTLIVTSCVGLSGVQQDACNKALEAGSKQSGISQTMNTYEKHELNSLQDGAINYLGKDTVNVLGGMGWLTKSLVEKKASFGLPNFGICDKLTTEINTNTTKLVFKWMF